MDTYRVNGVAVVKYTPDEPTGKAPIIMAYGGNHGVWVWELWAKFFRDAGYEVHVFDWFNHGNSDKLPDEEFLKRSILDVAHQEIKYVAEHLGQTPIVMGHSMGGLAAAAYAAEAPVERLVLLAPVVTKEAKADPIPLPVDMNQLFPAPPFEMAKQMFFTTLDDATAKRYYDLLVPESPEAVHEATQWSDTLDFSAVKAPTLIMAAEMDHVIPLEPLQRFDKLLHADFKIAKGVGHSDMLLKEPDYRDAAEQVRQWLES
jgi:pimeloyl-ACP methyl ester carboxylesterase